MKRRLPLLALLACMASVTAGAQTSTPSPSPAQSPSQAGAAAAPSTLDGAAKADRKPLSATHCVRQTGTRIAQRDDKQRCTALPGRAYSKEDIDRTGHTDLGDALRTLDPSIN